MGDAGHRNSSVRFAWPWALAVLLLALAGVFMTRRRRAARLGAADGRSAETLPESRQPSVPEEPVSGWEQRDSAGHTDGALPPADDEPLAAESGTAGDSAISSAADRAQAGSIQEPAVAAAGEATATSGGAKGDAHYRDFACTTGLPPKQSGGTAGQSHTLADKLAAAKALRASGHATEAASQAHEILQACDALDAKLQALTKRIQLE